MDVNDTYVYIIARAYKHFIFSGTGIRTLIDIYVYNESCKDSMNTEYICEQCKILSIQDYEKKLEKWLMNCLMYPQKIFQIYRNKSLNMLNTIFQVVHMVQLNKEYRMKFIN